MNNAIHVLSVIEKILRYKKFTQSMINFFTRKAKEFYSEVIIKNSLVCLTSNEKRNEIPLNSQNFW